MNLYLDLIRIGVREGGGRSRILDSVIHLRMFRVNRWLLVGRLGYGLYLNVFLRKLIR
ncbi:hypothetical protein Hdeb2414_s0015g00449821 [Helianthus debilis subsp. tardiflorus]